MAVAAAETYVVMLPQKTRKDVADVGDRAVFEEIPLAARATHRPVRPMTEHRA
jgi:hypothetical protein